MVVCPHGSTTKPGIPEQIVIYPGYMGSLLPPELVWALPYVPLLPPLTIDVGAFCAIDPPDIPSAAELLAAAGSIVGGNPAIKAASALVFLQLIKAYAWYSMCTCLIDTTPAPPTGPSAPTGLPGINPPVVVLPPGGGATPCYSIYFNTPLENGYFAYASWLDMDAYTSLTSVRITIHQPPRTGGGTTTPALWEVALAGDSNIPLYRYYNLPQSFDLVHTIQPTAVEHELRINATYAATDTLPTSVLIEGFCGDSQPGPTGGGGCPPDPVQTGLLNQILDLVTLIQRQQAPFAYIDGAVHSTLTGNGSFTVQGLIGLRIQITTLPDYLGHLAGAPTAIFDAGWIDVGDDSGYQAKRRLESVSQLWFPDGMGAMTLVGYTLPPNVVVRVTELVREP